MEEGGAKEGKGRVAPSFALPDLVSNLESIVQSIRKYTVQCGTNLKVGEVKTLK